MVTLPAGTAAVTAEAQAALLNAQAAEARLPQLMDQLAADTGRAQAANDAARQLQQQHAHAGQAATVELARRNEAVAAAAAMCDAAQARCDTVPGYDSRERRAVEAALSMAQITLEQARQSVARLNRLQQQAQAALATDLPALLAHVEASRDAVQATEAARRAHTGVADHSLGAAHRATVKQEFTRQEGVVAELHTRQRLAAAQLGSAGALQFERKQALCECKRLEDDVRLHERNLAGGAVKNLLGRALRHGSKKALQQARQQLSQAQQRLARAEVALTQQRKTVQNLGTQAHQALSGLQGLQDELARLGVGDVKASRDAVQMTEAARRAHTGVAGHLLSTAHRATEEKKVARQDVVVADLHTRHRLAAAQLEPAGALQVERQQALGECKRLEDDVRLHERYLAGGAVKNQLGRALRHGSKKALQQARQQLVQAQQRLASAEAALTQQRKAVQDLSTQVQQALQALPELQGLRDELARPGAGGAGQGAPPVSAQQADERAQQARTRAGTTERPALAAASSLLSLLDALRAELAPPATAGAKGQEAPARTAWQRTADGVRSTLKAWTDRTQPTRVYVTIGSLNWSSATSGPTTFTGHASGRTVTDKATGKGGLDAIDRKTAAAGTATAGLWAGCADASLSRPGAAARTPTAMRAATAFTGEVARLFEPLATDPAAGAASLEGLAPKVFANRLLDHPNPDPAARPDGHPLRHEEALLIASALSAVTTDPAVAVNLYNQLWNDAPALAGMARRNPAVLSPMAGMATNPRGAKVSTDPQTVQLAHAARRMLAGSPAGMEALQHLQGLAQPPAGHPGRVRAENALENYKLALRAETVLLKMLPVGGSQTTQDVLAAVRAAPVAQGLLDAARLGTGKAGREDPATLASQALAYAVANMQRAPDTPEAHPEFKPAYVALRNGFTEGGQGSDFNSLTKWLHKYVKYIERASARKEPVGFLDVVGQAGRLLKHATGKHKSPLTTLLEAGPLGSDLGHVPAEYRKQLDKTVNDCAAELDRHLAGNARGMNAGNRTRSLVRLAALQLWSERLATSVDPYAKVSLPHADVVQRANELAGQLRVPGTALDPAVLEAEMAGHLAGPMNVKALRAWFAKDQLADRLSGRNTATGQLRKSFDLLEGKGGFVTKLGELQRQFEQGDPAGRREVLRQLLVDVVTGCDMSAYSVGRKDAISGTVGLSPGGVGVNGVTVGVTPVVEVSYDRTKSSVLRAGICSTSGVVHLGRETRHAGSVGVGVRAGLEVGPGAFTVAAMARLGGTHTAAKGSMIRTRMRGVEHESLAPEVLAPLKATNWKRMTELAVNTIFDLAGADTGKPANGHDMWAGMVDKLGNYQDISFGYSRASGTTANWSLQGEGTAAACFGPKDKKSLGGLQFITGLKRTFRNRDQAGESTGTLRTFQSSSGSKLTGAAAVSAVMAHPTVKTSDGGSVTQLSRSKLGVESEMVFAAANGFMRLTTKDGRIDPAVAFKHREYNVAGDFFKLVNSQRATWEPRLGKRGTDGLLHNGADELDGFLHQVANLPPGRNRVFIERKNLTPEAADTINAYMERLGMLQRGLQAQATHGTQPLRGVLQEAEALRERIASELNNEPNWQPFRLYAFECNQLSKESSLAGAARYSPGDRETALSQPGDAAEAVERRGGQLVIGSHVRVARGGRDLVTLNAQPARA